MRTKKKGLSLIEILVVIAVFAILGIIAVRAVLLTLRGTRKSESVVKVRENLNYAMAVVERQLRNSEAIITSCPGSGQTIDYKDQDGITTSFSCVDVPANGYVASGSARLTSQEIVVTACSFTCTPGTSAVLPSVTVNFTGQSVGNVGVEGAEVSVQTQIFLRTY